MERAKLGDHQLTDQAWWTEDSAAGSPAQTAVHHADSRKGMTAASGGAGGTVHREQRH